MSAPTPKQDEIRALREAKFARKHSDGGVVSRHAGLDGQVGEADVTPRRVGGTVATASAKAGKASQQKKPRSRSPGPTNGGTRARALPLAAVASGPSETTPTKRGRPFKPETKDKPWLAEGISRRSWYRRKAEQREKTQ